MSKLRTLPLTVFACGAAALTLLASRADAFQQSGGARDEAWFQRVCRNLATAEYEFHADTGVAGAWSAPNRAQELRSGVTSDGLLLLPRTSSLDDAAPPWSVRVRTAACGRADGARATAAARLSIEGSRAALDHGAFEERVHNTPNGLAQEWIVCARPEGEGALAIELELCGDLAASVDAEARSATFSDRSGAVRLRYVELHAFDSAGMELPARFEPRPEGLEIVVDDTGALYPVIVDPVWMFFDWSHESNQASSGYGNVVAGVGDVNGDGFDDILVGAPNYDNGQTNEGRAFVFHGSATGPSLTPNWTAENNIAGTIFASAAAGAGDVNGDGYADVIIGAWRYDGTNGPGQLSGRAYVYHGSPSGLAAAPAWSETPQVAPWYFGYTVSGAGDVNGDGYDDVIVGAPNYQCCGLAGEGRAYVYHGSASGLSTPANWTYHGTLFNDTLGIAVSRAGDVNGDGYDDVIVGTWQSTNRALVFAGSPTGLGNTPLWTASSGRGFGWSLGTAGDVNGDGYDEVVVGEIEYSAGGLTNQGRAHVFYGSASGPSATADWIVSGGQAGALLGSPVTTAGDFNADGYSDLAVGVTGFDNGEADEGVALVFLGSGCGLETNASLLFEENQVSGVFGVCGGAGDVNGDGYDDLVVGAPGWDNGQTDEGRAFLYYGHSATPGSAGGSPNDDCSGAIVVGAGPTTFDTHCATASTNPGCTLNEGVWFSYTTPATCGTVTISGPLVAAYAGTCSGALEACGTGSITFVAQASTTFLIHVSWTTAGVQAQGTLTITHVSAGLAVNDACSAAIVTGTGLLYGTTTGATATAGGTLIPPPCGASGTTPDVWYSYTPSCDGTLTVDTCDLPCSAVRYDTVLAVYTGGCNGPLIQEGACSDEANCGTGYPSTSQVVVDVAGGTEYKLRVAGYSGATGDFALHLAFAGVAPPNDGICGALTIAPPCGSVAFNTCNATPSVAPGCPMFDDVWFQFTSPSCFGTTTVATCNSLFDTVLAVYSGTCTTPVLLACNDNAPANSACGSTLQSSVTFNSLSNTTYFVRVGSPTAGLTGSGIITVTCPAPVTCPPATGPAISGLFEITGPANGSAWAFRMTIPCCMDVYVPSVAGVPASGTQSTDEANLRDAFVSAINAACPSTPPIATAYPQGQNNVMVFGLFGIKARHCGANVAATLSVGAAGTPQNQLCIVTTSTLPTDHDCAFNPRITEVPLFGTDCNGNGEDDYVDIVSGTSADVDLNNVPDECPTPLDQAGYAYCFGDSLGAQPTTPCPCGNVGAPGNGCASSFNPAGAHLGATGKPVFDDVVLTISGTNSSPGVVVFTANNAIDPNGLQFGDGITCGGGSLVRMRGVATSAGAASFPVPPETITLSQRTFGAFGTVPGSGITVSYSAFYRNSSAAFCPPFTFNGPNNYRITW